MPGAKIVCFINYKGGVGKTTTTYHVGCSLAQHHGKRVLLVDIDPQTNLTFLCAPPPDWEKVKQRTGTIASMYKRFQEKKTIDTKRFIWTEPIRTPSGRLGGLDLIPCDVELLGEDLGGGHIGGTFPTLEMLRRQASEYLRERSFLRIALRDVETKYDYILIDCPPNLYLMTQNALVVSDSYVITAIPDHLSTIGLSILHKKVEKIGGYISSARTFAGESGASLSVAKFGGVVFVKVRVGGQMITVTHQNMMLKVRELLGKDACFQTHTTELIGFSEAAENCLPVWLHTSPNARRAANKGEYQEITEEFVKRY